MLAGLDGHQRMARAGKGVAGGLDDAFDPVKGAKRGGIVGHEGPAAIHRVAKGCGGIFALFPAGPGQRVAHLADIQIRDRDDVIALDLSRLREHHRAKLACADQSHADRLAGRISFGEHR